MKPIYLDYNATTPIDPRVAEAMRPYLTDHFGNPSSNHYFGRQARQAVETARQQVAKMIGAAPDEIVFTSGGTESNNWAIKGVAETLRHRGNHIITSAIEHPAVLEVCDYLENHGFRVTRVPVDSDGMVSVDAVAGAITPDTILITIMHANNEVGTIQPIADISRLAHSNDIIMHTDAAQSVGKIPVNVTELGVDLLSIAGHKLYAPKGIGALYMRKGLRLDKLMHGANHELNRRAGTENVLEIVGLGKASELVGENLAEYQKHYLKMRDRLENGLKKMLDVDLKLNGHSTLRLPNTCSISFRNLEANTILDELDGVAASAGAACHAESVEVSSVLEAMTLPLDFAMGTMRFSVGRQTTTGEIDQALKEIGNVVKRLQPKQTQMGSRIDTEEIKLTHFTHGLGCACKLRPQVLEQVLQALPKPTDKKILVGTDTADDAAVYAVDENVAVIQTVDFFTPIVDDPFQFGAIAAANSLSDIYAMGGKPAFALNIVGFPSNRLPISVLEEILAGAQSKAEEAGIAIIGGHTVDDTEPKFGLAVTGFVHPDKIWRNQGAQVGDVLILTKPLGTGILSTAMKRGMLNSDQAENLIQTMAQLNATAVENLVDLKVHACTDVTGFGLLGHLLEMVKPAQQTARLNFKEIPWLDGVWEMAMSGAIPGGTRDNFSYTEPYVQYAGTLTDLDRMLVNDAQTSGGLLVALSPEDAEGFLAKMNGAAWEIGEMVEPTTGVIKIVVD
ncbi:MAG: selenide, water dikinase SelD [Candidatus Marinimicrobia bacterium]|nr:selenide, water dikinase SelD [Candidatus Neomarinimicrobiota bacterium]